MVVGYRVCLTSMPNEPMLSTTGPRLGPVSRAGYEASWNAAGNPFKNGEPEFRTWNVNAACLPRRRKDPLGSFVSDGAAGRGSPRTEVRALDVDDHVRRAHSEPPKATRTRAETELAMQAFGIYSDVDSFAVRRRVQAETLPPTKAMIGRTAMEFTDITSVLRRKTFHDAAPPGSSLSPRMAAKSLESIDIDSYYGRRRSVSCEPSCRSAPWSCASFDSPVRGRRQFFEQILSAEKYASLIGRPHFRSQEELADIAAGNAEMQRIEEMERGWQRSDVVQATVSPHKPKKSALHQFQQRAKRTGSSDTVSTASSDWLHSSLQSVAESEQEDWTSLSEIAEDEYENFNMMPVVPDCFDEQVLASEVPLGLRRVLSSFNQAELSSVLQRQGPIVEKLRTSIKRTPREPMTKAKVPMRNRGTNQKHTVRVGAVGQLKASLNFESIAIQSELSNLARIKLQKDVESILRKAY